MRIIIFGAIAILIIAGAGFMILKNDSSEVAESHEDGDIEEYEIYPGDVAQKIEKGEKFILLDVRTPEEYEEVHLAGALLLPVQELSQQSLALLGLGESAKDKEIIIYCRSGARSKTAYDIMKSLGYTNIKSVAGGIIHWEEDNYPFTETGAYTGPRTIDGRAEVVSENGPQITLDRTFHDFGVVPQYGGTVTATFDVKNEGSETLTVGDITTSCSCTSASISATSIDPGKTTKLTVVFNPNFHEEPLDVFKRTVFIPTNDPITPEVEIVIQVDIAEGK